MCDYVRKSARLTLAAAIIAAVWTSYPSQGAEQIRWRSGTVATTPKSLDEIAGVISNIAATEDERHLVVQFAKPVTPAQRAKLRAAGLELQAYLSDNAYFAAVSTDQLDPSAVRETGNLIDAKPVEPIWKLHPYLAAGQVPTWAVVSAPEAAGKAGPVVVGTYVLFHEDVRLVPYGANIARRHGALVRDYLESINGLVIELPFDRISGLVAEDAVKWVEPPLPRMEELNNSNRNITGANIVQAPPYNLDGTGVTVLVYDGGYARSSHVDFGGRLTVRDSSGQSDHATHVSCTVGGSGSASGGTYHGMAPNVTIQSYGFDYDGTGIFLYSNPGDIETDYDEAINTYGADISNNSIGTNTCWNGFPCSITGNYGTTSVLIDEIVAGSLGEPFRVVWANGNERSCTGCPDEHHNGYHSTAPPACAKNHITVGALNSNDDSQTDFTSWGPADDGRMKPDIAAPGCQSNDDFEVTSCSSASDTAYTGKCGTSMASPTVTGLSALLLQDFRIQFPEKPDFRNSTLKALLAHNAVDLAPLGPDYKAGYGSVRIQPTIDFMRSENFLEAQVGQGGAYSVLVVVNPGDGAFKVTLAWDDVPGTPDVNPALVNDLDLVVHDPLGVRHYPWTLDPGNPSFAAVRTQADHVNNIEQVYVESPASGAWQVEIQGYNVPQGPQAFSICGSPMLVNCSTTGVVSLDRPKYACESTADIQVIDCDLNTDNEVVETVSVTIASSTEPAGETVLLTETGAATSAFRGPIPLSMTDAAGVLHIASGDTVTATYTDADDGFGGINVEVEDVAIVDCDPPDIFFVQVLDLEPRSATVTFQTNEPTIATIRYGLTCGALTETASNPGYTSGHSIGLKDLEDDTAYFFAIDAVDEAGNAGTNDNGGVCFSFTTPAIPDFFTEEFASSDNDLSYKSITFIPDGSEDYYYACAELEIDELPTDPAGGTSISLDDDEYENITIAGGNTVELYGEAYSSFYVSANGYVTFTAGDGEYTESLSEHFSMPRVSALFDDFDPSSGGTVSWQQLGDRVVVSHLNVPEWNTSNSNTFQFEMFFDGTIRLSYLGLAAQDGIVGLSDGSGVPADFYETDVSEVGPCVTPGDCDMDGDTDEYDFAVFSDCFSGAGGGVAPGCRCANLDGDQDVDCKDWNVFKQLWTGPEDPPVFGPCEQPDVWAEGGRYLAVQPKAGSNEVALLVTGDPKDPNVSCLSLYVQDDGTLGEPPVFRLPDGAGGWGIAHVHGEEIVPDTLYLVQGDYGSPGSPLLSLADSATTWLWGDVAHNDVVSFDDIQAIVFGFMVDPGAPPFEAMEIDPCVLDGVINFSDIYAAVLAFQGVGYLDGACTPPCP
ncbi:MAG: S8 family serine peptidase [Planctomycetes bacterium]|nr:S8 family serine peptidase [Planctomycetota bacterium]